MINLHEINNGGNESLLKHKEFIFCYIYNRLRETPKVLSCTKYEKTNFPRKTTVKNPKTFPFLKKFIKDHIDVIISELPEELEKIHKQFSKELEEELDEEYPGVTDEDRLLRKNETIEELKSIIDYSGFFLGLEPVTDDYSAYHLAKNIGVRSCVYCNRVYTLTHNTRSGGKLMRPQFDHWYPKSKYPLLALSFYNLIPSCSSCNGSVKGDKDMNLKQHVHPYLENPKDDGFEFNYFFKNNLTEYEVIIDKVGKGTKYKDTLEFLKINEMYDGHQYELKDLIKLSQAYSINYLTKLKDSFPDARLTDNEIYRLAFGAELDSKDFHKRPMSKFKHDILKELGIM